MSEEIKALEERLKAVERHVITTSALSPPTQDDAEPVYSRVRTKVEHEDDLVHQRLTWLMTLQGLLFTAYGFSMTAEAAALTSKGLEKFAKQAAKDALLNFTSNLTNIRQGLVLLGILSSIAALAGVLAAFRAIKDDAGLWRAHTQKTPKTPFPEVIGTGSANTLGMLCGISLPFMTATGWVWVGGLYQTHNTATWICGVAAVLVTLSYVFFRLRD